MAKKDNNFLVIVVLSIALISVLVSVFNPVLNRTELRASFVFSENNGFGNIPGEVFFGAINNESSATRKILIENYFDENVLINIKSRGEISDNLIVSENNFLLFSGESKEISFSVHPENLEDYREYDGKIIITTKKI